MTVSNNSTTTCHNPDPLCPSKPKTTLKVPWWCSLFFSLKNGALFGSSLLFLPKITALSVLIPQHWWKFALSTVSMGSREFFPIPVYESIISRMHICKVCKWTHGYLHRFQDIYILLCWYEVFWFAIHTKCLSNGVCCSRILDSILSLDSHRVGQSETSE